MSVAHPKFYGLDGGLTDHLVKTSSRRSHILRGEVPDQTVQLQVDLNGQGYSSSEVPVDLEKNTFRLPHSDVFPEGLRLRSGQNTIRIRAIRTTGSISDEARAEINVVAQNDIDTTIKAPTGLKVRRREHGPELSWHAHDHPHVQGYHVYAAREPGGGSEGYHRVNRRMLTDSTEHDRHTQTLQSDTVRYERDQSSLRLLMSEENPQSQPTRTLQDTAVDLSQARDEIEIDISVKGVTTQPVFSFHHPRQQRSDRTINDGRFRDIPLNEPLYYVITAVARDPVLNQEIESSHSEELVGLPLNIDRTLESMPRRTRDDVARDYIEHIHQFNEQISLMPGSVTRDVFVEPFATEAQRLYFISDFVRRSQSLSSLLVIDETTSYQESLRDALGLNSLEQVQSLIDDSIERLAGNVQVQRQEARTARGEVLFYTDTEPQQDHVIDQGTLVAAEQESGAPPFEVTARVVLPSENANAFYNPDRDRWERRASIEATEPGAAGNVAAQTITRVIGRGASGLKVINPESTQFGQDEESNQSLVERALLAFTSVDTGTEQGYLSEVLEHPETITADVQQAGDPYMLRDLHDGMHIGGKVDIWVQGQNFEETSGEFALSFETLRNIPFELRGDPDEQVFVGQHPELSSDKPITRVLGQTPQEQQQGLGLRNVTTGRTFRLENVSILGPRTIQLDTSLNQPNVRVHDQIRGDVQTVRSDHIPLSRQPVRSINAVESLDTDQSLDLDEQVFLDRSQNPLLRGRSTHADHRLVIRQKDGQPSGDLIMVNDETHVLIGESSKQLHKLGVRPQSVRVFNQDRTTEYQGPDDSNPDFDVELGGNTQPTRLRRTTSSEISNGEEVSVDYAHDENFRVTYSTNQLLHTLQNRINRMRHITADVLVKGAVPHPIRIAMTVRLTRAATQASIDQQLQTALSQMINTKKMGEPLHQSDIVHRVEQIEGVDHVVTELNTLTHQVGNPILRESVAPNLETITRTGTTTVAVFQEPLEFPVQSNETTDAFRHQAVRLDNQALDLVSSWDALQEEPYRAIIVGHEGRVFPGWSDDDTLQDLERSETTTIEALRRERTANRVFVSLPSSRVTDRLDVRVSYHTAEDDSSRSTISTSPISQVELGSLTVDYDVIGSGGR